MGDQPPADTRYERLSAAINGIRVVLRQYANEANWETGPDGRQTWKPGAGPEYARKALAQLLDASKPG